MSRRCDIAHSWWKDGGEHIRAMIAEDEAEEATTLASDATGGRIPIVAAVAEERMAAPIMIAAA